MNNNIASKEKYRKINFFIFSILLVIYSYFENESYKSLKLKNQTKRKKNLDFLSFIASSFILISGLIFLYIIVVDKNIESEIAFN